MEQYEQFSVGEQESQAQPFQNNKKGLKISNYWKSKQNFCLFVILPVITLCILLIINYFESSKLTDRKNKKMEIENEKVSLQATNHEKTLQYHQFIEEKNKLETDNSNLQESNNALELENTEIMKKNELETPLLTLINEKKEKIQEKINQEETAKKEIEEKINLLTETLNKLKRQINENPNQSQTKVESIDIIDSEIITDVSQVNLFKDWIDISDEYSFHLLYRATSHGYSSSTFHKKCDKARMSLVLIKELNGNIFGGFTKQSWEGLGFKEDSEAFLFNLIKKKKYPVRDATEAIYCDPECLCVFGKSDIYLNTIDKFTVFPVNYGDDSCPKNDITNGYNLINLENIEVFDLIFA